MNELIRKLAEQAGAQKIDEAEGFAQFLQNFAELLIGECLGAADSVESCSTGTEVADAIIEHFGLR